jgi:hypothetical protein
MYRIIIERTENEKSKEILNYPFDIKEEKHVSFEVLPVAKEVEKHVDDVEVVPDNEIDIQEIFDRFHKYKMEKQQQKNEEKPVEIVEPAEPVEVELVVPEPAEPVQPEQDNVSVVEHDDDDDEPLAIPITTPYHLRIVSVTDGVTIDTDSFNYHTIQFDGGILINLEYKLHSRINGCTVVKVELSPDVCPRKFLSGTRVIGNGGTIIDTNRVGLAMNAVCRSIKDTREIEIMTNLFESDYTCSLMFTCKV